MEEELLEVKQDKLKAEALLKHEMESNLQKQAELHHMLSRVATVELDRISMEEALGAQKEERALLESQMNAAQKALKRGLTLTTSLNRNPLRRL